jgi:hypothetical protein
MKNPRHESDMERSGTGSQRKQMYAVWKRSPGQLGAIHAVDDAKAHGVIQRHQDLIIALAVEHDERCH